MVGDPTSKDCLRVPEPGGENPPPIRARKNRRGISRGRTKQCCTINTCPSCTSTMFSHQSCFEGGHGCRGRGSGGGVPVRDDGPRVSKDPFGLGRRGPIYRGCPGSPLQDKIGEGGRVCETLDPRGFFSSSYEGCGTGRDPRWPLSGWKTRVVPGVEIPLLFVALLG